MLIEDVKQSGLDYGMFERVAEAWTWLREWAPAPARVRVVGDDDSDGVTSAHAVASTLRRAGYEVDIKIMPVHSQVDVDVVYKDPRDAYAILDSGSGLIDYIDQFRYPTLILDHHRVRDFTPQNTFEVNPRRVAGDKVEHVSTSVLAALFALHEDDNWDMAVPGLAGAVSDRQHLGGFSGLVGYLSQGAIRHGVVSPSTGLTLVGTTVLEAIADSLDPYFEHYTGKPEAVRSLLARHGVGPAESPILVTGDRAASLAKELTESLVRRGVVTSRMAPLYGERFLLKHASGVQTLFGLSHVLEAATAAESHDVALKTLAGDIHAARQARLIAKQRVTGILQEVQRLRGATQELPSLRWSETRDEANTGIYAHTLLTFVFGDDKPYVIVSRKNDDAKCSARGSPRLYGAGLDLSIAMHEAAQKVGGHGGGHPGASGATVPYAKRDEFLRALDESLGRLGRGTAA